MICLAMALVFLCQAGPRASSFSNGWTISGFEAVASTEPYTYRRLWIRTLTLNRAVAWSRTGSIANITPDGQNVELRYLRRSPEDGSWDLSEPTICPFVKGTPTVPIVHLLWAGTSSPDLAVIDAAGRVTIVSFSISLNHPFPQRKWDADPTDDVHTVVGSYWLTVAPTNQQVRAARQFPAQQR